MNASPVIVEIDLDAPGRAFGRIRVPFSTNECGWNTVPVPVVSIANGSGPTVLLTAGNHGDEYEGQVALLDLAKELDPARVSGRVILMPAMNMPAARAGVRKTPLDDRDFNRCFPGDPRGSFSPVLAHWIDTVLLPRCDAQMDLHSGGLGMDIVPSAVGHVLPDPAYMARTLAMADAFGAPVSLLLREVNAGPTLLAAAEARGIPALSSELGGGRRLPATNLAITSRGVRALLVHLEVADLDVTPAPERSRRMTTPDMSFYVFAPHAGIFEHAHALGAAVRAGEVAGRLHRIEDPSAPPAILRYAADGMLWCGRAAARVGEGEPVCVLARDLRPEDLS